MSFEAIEWNLGLKSYRFVADRKMLAGPAENPDNWCFCKDGNQTHCSPSGTCDISRCRYGAPAFISYPHFYLGDESLSEAVDGMKPDPAKHKMTLSIEPVCEHFPFVPFFLGMGMVSVGLQFAPWIICRLWSAKNCQLPNPTFQRLEMRIEF
jgi:hypothetical protein